MQALSYCAGSERCGWVNMPHGYQHPGHPANIFRGSAKQELGSSAAVQHPQSSSPMKGSERPVLPCLAMHQAQLHKILTCSDSKAPHKGAWQPASPIAALHKVRQET